MDGVLFDKGISYLHTYPSNKAGDSYVVPSTVTSIGGSAFYGCTSLASVTIPGSVISIGDYAFYSCGSLTSVVIPDSVTVIGYSAFDGLKFIIDGNEVAHTSSNLAGRTWVGSGTDSKLYVLGSGRDIVFDPCGGSSTSLLMTTVDGRLPSMPDAVCEGSVFLGWYTEKKGGERMLPGAVVPSGISTFYARWSPTECTVTYMSEGKVFAEQQYASGDTIVLPGTSPVKGSTVDRVFTFSKWNGYSAGMKVTGNVTFTAEFTESARMYEVVWKNGEEVLKTQELAHGTVIVAPSENPVSPGADFSGWNGFTDGMTVSGNHVFTAMFGPVTTYKIVFMSGDVIVQEYGLVAGSVMTVPADPVLEGYEFIGWTAVPGVMPSEDVTVHAKWRVSEEKHVVDSGDDVIDPSDLDVVDLVEGDLVSVKPTGDRLDVKDDAMDHMADRGVDLEVVIGDVSVRYSGGVLDGLRGKDVQIEIRENPSDMNQQQLDVVGNSFSISLRLFAGGDDVTGLGGKATISMPYILGEGQTVDNVTVFCVAEDGTVSERTTWYDSRSSNLFFETETHSVYYVGESEPSSSGGMDMTMVAVGVVAAVVVAVAALLYVRSKN